MTSEYVWGGEVVMRNRGHERKRWMAIISHTQTGKGFFGYKDWLTAPTVIRSMGWTWREAAGVTLYPQRKSPAR